MLCFLQRLFLLGFIVIIQLSATAQQVTEPKTTEEWLAPYQAFRIVGNLYYVGTRDLACYLISTINGNILINTGLAASAVQIRKNIETLGFQVEGYKDPSDFASPL